MDDEEKRLHEEEDKQLRKRRQKQAEEQDEEEEAWKSKRQSSRVEVDEVDEDANNEDDKKKDKKEEKDDNGEDNQDGDNQDEGRQDKNNQDENSQDTSKDKTDDSTGNNSQDNKVDKENQNNNKSDSSTNRETSNGSRNQNTGRDTSSKPSSTKSQNKPKESAKPQSGSPKAPQGGKGANINTASKTSNLGAKTTANASKTAASSTGAGGAQSATKIGKIIAKFGSGLIVILIIIIILGIIFFFLTMPGMVVGKIGQALDTFFTGIANFFDGDGAAQRSVNREQVIKAARYLDDMGYDLQGYGFLDDEKKDIVSAKEDTGFLDSLTSVFFDDGANSIDPTEINIEDFEETDYKERIEREKEAGRAGDDIKQVVLSKTWEEVKNKDDDEIKKSMIMMRGSDGEIEFAKSKYLYMYLVAANTTYLVRNDNVDFAGRVLKLIGSNPEAKENGVGLIYFTYPEPDASGYAPKPKDYVSGISADVDFEKPESGIQMFGRTVLAFSNRYKVDKDQKQLIIYNSDDGWFKSTFYTYNLGGWISQYGMPLQLSLALHLSTMAPDFAYEVAQNAAFKTRVEMGLIELKGVDIKLQLMLDLEGNGQPKKYTVEKDTAWHIHRTGSDKDEDGYDSQDEANRQGATDEGDISSDDKKDYENLEEALDAYCDEMDRITNNGTDKQVAGSLIYCASSEREVRDSGLAFDYNSLYPNGTIFYASEAGKLSDYSITITSPYINKLQSLLITYKAKGESEPRGKIDGDKFKLTNTSNVTVHGQSKDLSQIVGAYFKTADVQYSYYDDPHCKVREYDSDGKPEYYKSAILGDANNPNITWNEIVTNGEEMTEYEDDLINVYRYPVGTGADNSTYYDWVYIGKNNDFITEYGYSGGRGTYYKSSISGWYQIVFEGRQPEVQKSIWDEIKEFFAKYWPIRIYYRLIDENGDPVKWLTKDHGFNDYCYATGTGGRSYYKNDDGWFWRKSIPVELYNAVKRAESKQAAIQRAMDSGNYQEGQEVSFDWVDIQKGHGTDVSESEATGIKSILSKSYDMNTEDFTKYIPIVMKVTDHWFEDLDYDAIEGSADGQKSPCYKFDDSENIESTYVYMAVNGDSSAVQKASKAEIMYIQEKAPGKITQEHKPKSKNRGVYLEELLKQDYYIYDGYGRSKEKKKIDFENISVDAIAMLEQIQGEDAQQIIRMFKIFMATHGVEFEATEATAYKKEICSKILSKGDWDCEQHLLVEDNSSYVLRADIPPSQYGFPVSTESKMIYALAPVNGEVVYRSDDNVCIKINDTAKHKMDETGSVIKSVKDWTLLISGIAVHDDIQEGKIVTVGQQIGHTVKRDIKMVLRDENGAIVENTYKTTVKGEQINTSPVQYDEHQGNVTREVNGYRTADDIYYVVQHNSEFSQEEKNRIGEANGEFIQALEEMEQAYGIDPLWALTLMHFETNCGLANEHSLFSIHKWTEYGTGKDISKGNGTFTLYVGSTRHDILTYASDRDAIIDFGLYVCKHFSGKLTTVDDFQKYDGTNPYDYAKEKAYPLYLQLKTILSGKGV